MKLLWDDLAMEANLLAIYNHYQRAELGSTKKQLQLVVR